MRFNVHSDEVDVYTFIIFLALLAGSQSLFCFWYDTQYMRSAFFVHFVCPEWRNIPGIDRKYMVFFKIKMQSRKKRLHCLEHGGKHQMLLHWHSHLLLRAFSSSNRFFLYGQNSFMVVLQSGNYQEATLLKVSGKVHEKHFSQKQFWWNRAVF